MISIVRSFGAPVIEPPGNVARIQVGEVDVVAQQAADRRHHLVHAPRSSRRPSAWRRRPEPICDTRPEIVAQQVDDHEVLGAVLGALEQAVARRRVGERVGVAGPSCP